MKKPYLLLLLISVFCSSQEFEWVATPPINISLNPDLIGYVTGCDQSGGNYLIGFKDHATPYSDIFGDLLYNKYNDAGELQFSNTFTGKGSVYDIAVDQWGNVILVIGYLNNLTIGSLELSTVNQGVEPLLVKFDSQGNLLWHYEPLINGSPASYFKAVTVDDLGNIYIGYDNFNASYIEKLTPDGVQGMLITQQHVSLLSSLDTDTEGNIYAVGSCVDPGSTFNGVAVATNLFYNSYIVKYAADGTYKWVRFVDDITCPTPEVKANTPNEVYFSSYLVDNYVFDGIQTEGPTAGNFNDFFLTRLDESGTFQWVREVPGAGNVYPGKRNSLTTDLNGNVYFAGNTRWTIDWGNGMSTSTPSFAGDGIILKYNNSGDLLMVKTAGGTSEDRFDGVSVDGFGNIYLSGMARSNANFGTITHTADGNLPYAFLTKINANPLSTTQFEAQDHLILYPNPVGDYLHFANQAGKISGKVYNALGQSVLSIETNGNAAVPVGDLTKGVYVIQTNKGNARFVK